MKTRINTIIIIILSVALATSIIVGIAINRTHINEIESLNRKIEQIDHPEFTRVTVTNDYWERSASRNMLYGNIFLSDFSQVDHLEVTYKDIMFNTLEDEVETTVTTNEAENRLSTSCLHTEDAEPYFVVVSVYYLDGRSEDITVRIAMG